MKKKILIVLLLFIIADSLSAQTDPLQKAVIFKKSSAFCSPCGTWGWDLQSQVESDNSLNAVIFQVQIAPASDLYNSAGKELMDAFNDCNYYPAWFVNGKNKTVVSGSGVYPGLTREAIKKSADSIRMVPPLASCSCSVQTGTGSLSVTVTTRFLADTSGAYYVSVLLIDKNATSYQNGIGNEALHINVLRGAMGESAFGQPVTPGLIRKYDTFTSTFTQPLIAGVDPEKQSLAIILWKKEGSKYSFVNAFNQDQTATSAEIHEGTPSRFRVYPNPATEEIFIECSPAPVREAKTVLTDLRGNVLSTQRLKEQKTRMDLRGFSRGIYLLKLVVDGKQEVRKIRIG